MQRYKYIEKDISFYVSMLKNLIPGIEVYPLENNNPPKKKRTLKLLPIPLRKALFTIACAPNQVQDTEGDGPVTKVKQGRRPSQRQGFWGKGL